MYKISEKGISMIKEFEGFRGSAYKDAVGKPTIGFGHLIKKGEVFPSRITIEQADSLIRSDLRDSVSAVNNFVTSKLSQNQADALVSFVFNIGGDKFKRSTLLRRINSNDFGLASKEFNKWVYGKFGGTMTKLGGLVQRRKKESELFKMG